MYQKSLTVGGIATANYVESLGMVIPPQNYSNANTVAFSTIVGTGKAPILPLFTQQQVPIASNPLEAREKPLPNLSPVFQQSSACSGPTEITDSIISALPRTAQQTSTVTGPSETMSRSLSSHPSTTQQSWVTIFPQNLALPPVFSTILPSKSTRFENTTQLAYCSILLSKYLLTLPAAKARDNSLDPAHQALIEPFLQDEEKQNRVRWLIKRIIEKFAADRLTSKAILSEVLVLGPALDPEYYRKLLNCVIAEFKNATTLDIDLLQGLIQLVQCASPDYLTADDLVGISAVLQIRLQNIH